MLNPRPVNLVSDRTIGLVKYLGNDDFRDAYLSERLKLFLANQIRSLRGDASQAAFGKIVGKPQSVVSRLEDPEHGNVTVQTLLDVAHKLKLALIVQFVDWPTFLQFTENTSEKMLTPDLYNQQKMDELLLTEGRIGSIATSSEFQSSAIEAKDLLGRHFQNNVQYPKRVDRTRDDAQVMALIRVRNDPQYFGSY